MNRPCRFNRETAGQRFCAKVSGGSRERLSGVPRRRACFVCGDARTGNAIDEEVTKSVMEDESKIFPGEAVARLRTLAHDLSNSIETVMQASYLLAQSKLDDSHQKWLNMIETAAQDAARINREIREILRSHS